MAEKLDDYDFTARRNGGRDGKYPWNEWADGSIWRVKRGEDFECKTATFQKYLGAWARRHGYLVSATREEDAMVFQMLKESA